jgi:hypothetical protein
VPVGSVEDHLHDAVGAVDLQLIAHGRERTTCRIGPRAAGDRGAVIGPERSRTAA